LPNRQLFIEKFSKHQEDYYGGN